MLGANYAPLTWYGQEWRLFTHIFMHSNVFHLLVNSLALWAVWKRSALVFYTGTQLYIFLVCGVVSGWVGATQQFGAVSVGSSGAILGLLAAVVGWSIARGYIRREVKKAVSGFPALVLVVVMFSGFFLPGMDMYANLGGVVAGLLFGMFISSKSEKENRVVTGIVLTGITLALLCGAMVFARPSEEKMQRVQRTHASEKAIAAIHETDRKAEEAMKRLWQSEGADEGLKGRGATDITGKASREKQTEPRGYVEKDERAWRLQWHAQVVIPMERNAVMAASLEVNPQDVYVEHLHLLQLYTVARLQEARLLELGREQVQTIGTPGFELRQNILDLNRQIEALNKPKDLIETPAAPPLLK
jgi:membrane associated rhomboid family serine protease